MDMPKLSDSRRIARLAMVLDEILNSKESSDLFDMSNNEFVMCGGVCKSDKRYSIYRQLVYATRDIRAFVSRQRFPDSYALNKSNKIYTFYNNDVIYDESSDKYMNPKYFNSILRLLIVFQKYRKHIKRNDTHADVRRFTKSIQLTYSEHLLCGGKKMKKHDNRFPIKPYVEYALEDLKKYIIRKRMPPPCVMKKAWNSGGNECIEDSDEEDVDGIDNGKEYHLCVCQSYVKGILCMCESRTDICDTEQYNSESENDDEDEEEDNYEFCEDNS